MTMEEKVTLFLGWATAYAFPIIGFTIIFHEVTK